MCLMCVPKARMVSGGSTSRNNIVSSKLFVEEKGENNLEFLKGFRTLSVKVIVTCVPTGVLPLFLL